MSARFDARAVVGVLFVILGLAFLGGVLAPATAAFQLVLGLALAGTGGAMLFEFGRHRRAWLAPTGAGTAAIGLLIAADSIHTGGLGDWGGVLLLGAVGLGFLAIARVPEAHWWPIIPAGVLLTLAALAGLPAGGTLGGAFLFAGLAATFVIVFLAPPAPFTRVWALVAGGTCAVIAIAVVGMHPEVMGTATAIALIAAGAWLLFRGRHTTA